MRHTLLIVILAAAVLGCAHRAGNPISATLPEGDSSEGAPTLSQAADLYDGPYRLWGEWTLYFNAEHDQVGVVPRRHGQFHLNALKFLEEYCTNCLQITQIKSNGDGTVDLTVRISHPFPGHPEYTGFDVKGIIMFNGSYVFPTYDGATFPLPNPCRLSWRELGDPDVLNPDGYTHRWSPSWDSGSDLPMFNYWEGKYATGVPNADVNAYLNFYSIPERHMFSVDSAVTRTYTIWLPSGEPVVAGYAVEACWEPPTVTPVTNPLEDFPITANQPGAYHFKLVINNGEVITDTSECCWHCDCSDIRVEVKRWGDFTTEWLSLFFHDGHDEGGGILRQCTPPQEDVFYPWGFSGLVYGNGTFRELAVSFARSLGGPRRHYTYDLYEYTVNEPD